MLYLLQHEDASVMMLDHLIEENGLMEEMEKYGLYDNEVTFIKEMIVGPTQDKEKTPQKVSCILTPVANLLCFLVCVAGMGV